nr:MAG TPA: hypothetical protein [Caudoviricetes sp.]
MKVEAFVYGKDGKDMGVLVYNNIDIESIINDLQISFGDWGYASIECEAGTYMALPNGWYEEYEKYE